MRVLLLPLVIILLGIFSALLMSSFLFTGIQDNSQDFIFQRKALAQIEANFENQKNLQKIYQNFESDLEKIETLFVKKDAPIEFIEFLEQKARRCSLSIEISSLFTKEQEDKWEYLSLQMDLEGEPQQFLKFLDQIENSLYFIEIEKLNLKKAGRERQEAIDAFLIIKVPVK